MSNPKVGDRFLNHGHLHEIIGLTKRGGMNDDKETARVALFAVWETDDGDGYKGICEVPTMVWSEADQAWYQPGQVLARNERALCQAVTGAWPPAETHMEMRAMLDTVDLSGIDRKRLGKVLIERKQDVRTRLQALQDEAEAAGADPGEAVGAGLNEYIDAVLVQCASLRTAREGWTS